jgi:hypothetical protein
MIPPVSVSSPYSRRRPNESEISIGRENASSRIPAALDPGFGRLRPQKRRQPSTRKIPMTPHAASPNSV